MAKKDDTEKEQDGKDDKEAEGGASSGAARKKLIIIVAVAVLAVAASIGGTLFLLGFFDGGDTAAAESTAAAEGDEKGEGDTEGKAESAKAKKHASAKYFPITPSIIVNFQSPGRKRLLKVDITVLTRDAKVLKALKTHLPLIKNQLVMLFSGEVFEELQTDEGKELLRQRSQETLNKIMEQEIGSKAGVEQVLFTNFVMQ